MILIVCVDDRGGMAFAGRRQSRDRIVYERMLEMTEKTTLWVSESAYKLFEAAHERVMAENGHAQRAGKGEYCFLETESPLKYMDRLEGLVVYRWNRVYPSDLRFDIPLDGFKLVSTQEFAGSSHERITEEVYTR